MSWTRRHERRALTNSRAQTARRHHGRRSAVVFHSQRTRQPQVFLQPITSSGRSAAYPGARRQLTSPRCRRRGDHRIRVEPEGNNTIWLMSKDGSASVPFTRGPQSRKPRRFLRDGSLAYLWNRSRTAAPSRRSSRPTSHTGKGTPLSGVDLVVADFTVSPGRDLLGLVVAVQKNVFRVYVQPVGSAGSGAPVPIPTTGAEQMCPPLSCRNGGAPAMRAWVIRTYGGLYQLEIADVPDPAGPPEPGAGSVSSSARRRSTACISSSCGVASRIPLPSYPRRRRARVVEAVALESQSVRPGDR